jgi:hypothetical protein
MYTFPLSIDKQRWTAPFLFRRLLLSIKLLSRCDRSKRYPLYSAKEQCVSDKPYEYCRAAKAYQRNSSAAVELNDKTEFC